MSHDIEQIRTTLAELYAQSPRGPLSDRQIVAICIREPAGVDLVTRYLNGESPNGNSIMDRKDVADGIRIIAEKLKTPFPISTKTIKIARLIMEEMRKANVPVLRTGRMDLQIEHNPTPE